MRRFGIDLGMKFPDYVFVGIRGSVVGLDRITGAILWTTKLKGSDFVNIVRDDVFLYASTYGEVFCLDPTNGEIRWHNTLKGYGLGLSTLVAGAGGDQNSPVLAEKERRRQQENSSSTTMNS
jgi:outer membrane protein assembly factor BamB